MAIQTRARARAAALKHRAGDRLTRIGQRLQSQPPGTLPASPTQPPGLPYQIPPRIDPDALGGRDSQLSGWFLEDSDELFKDMPISAEHTVLDVGCGESGVVTFCAQRGAAIVAVDILPEKVESARQRLADSPARSVEVHVAGAEDLPIDSNSVQRVVCTEVLEHVDDPAVVMRELVRVGEPGALYLLAVPDSRSELLQEATGHPSYFEKPNHIRIIERDEFEAMATDAGLEIIRHDFYGFFWAMWWGLLWHTELTRPVGPNPVLDHWCWLWDALLASPRGMEYLERFNSFMPKSQVIIARKPQG